MSLVLELPPELERHLAAEAAGLQLALPDYILRLLATARTTTSQPRNGSELVAYWESAELIGSRPDIVDPAGHARALRQRAEQRKRP